MNFYVQKNKLFYRYHRPGMIDWRLSRNVHKSQNDNCPPDLARHLCCVQQLNDRFIDHGNITAAFNFLVSNKNYDQQVIDGLNERFHSKVSDQQVGGTDVKLWSMFCVFLVCAMTARFQIFSNITRYTLWTRKNFFPHWNP